MIILIATDFFLILASNVNGYNFSLNYILRKTIRDENPYQITVLTDEKWYQSSEVVAVTDEYPNMKLKLNNFEPKKLNFLSSTEILKKTFKISLIIAFVDDAYFVRQIIDYVAEVVHVYERPKFLCILSNEEKFFNQSIKNTLNYAWKNKFLDFTVIKIDRKKVNSSLVYYLDPFNDLVSKKPLENGSVIFLKKTLNINNYYLKVTNYREDVDGKKNRDQEAEDARQHLFVNYAFETMNFLIKTVELPTELLWDYKTNHLRFSKYKANAIASPVVATEIQLDKMVSVYSGLPCSLVLAAVPIIYVPKVMIPARIVFYIFVIPSIMFCFIYSVGYVVGRRFNRFFEVVDAVRLFMGQSPVNTVPRTLSQKIVYVTILALFLLITNDLYSDIVEINFDKEEVPFESLEDLANSPMPMSYNGYYPDLFSFNFDDPLFKKLESKLKPMDCAETSDCSGGSECIEKLLIPTRNHICIEWQHLVQARIRDYRNSDGSPILKSTPYLCDPMFILFEPGSPYAKSYERTLRLIQESGIMRMVYFIHGFVTRLGDVQMVTDPKNKDEKNLSQQQLIFILLFGYFIAAIAFTLECFVHKSSNTFRKKKRKLRFCKSNLHVRI